MNAPVSDLGGVREALCHQDMIEQLGLIAVYAGIAQQLLDVGDAAGADYALRRMSAHARAAIAAGNHLNGEKKPEAACP